LGGLPYTDNRANNSCPISASPGVEARCRCRKVWLTWIIIIIIIIISILVCNILTPNCVKYLSCRAAGQGCMVPVQASLHSTGMQTHLMLPLEQQHLETSDILWFCLLQGRRPGMYGASASFNPGTGMQTHPMRPSEQQHLVIVLFHVLQGRRPGMYGASASFNPGTGTKTHPLLCSEQNSHPNLYLIVSSAGPPARHIWCQRKLHARHWPHSSAGAAAALCQHACALPAARRRWLRRKLHSSTAAAAAGAP
jgi:hypothetical protein